MNSGPVQGVMVDDVQMIKTAAQKPQDRMRFIERAAAEQARQADPTIRAMGLSVDPKMMEVCHGKFSAPFQSLSMNMGRQHLVGPVSQNRFPERHPFRLPGTQTHGAKGKERG